MQHGAVPFPVPSRLLPLPLALWGSVLFTTGCDKKAEGPPKLDGRQIYASVCARCHGVDGRGGVPSEDGGPAPRNFTDAAFQMAIGDEQIKTTITQGKGAAMPAFGSAFDDAQLTELVSVVRSFRSR